MVDTVLIVVDYQTDFVTGSLGNPAAAALERGIAEKVEQTLRQGGCVVFTRDTHDAQYLDTREGKFLSVPHCIEGMPGWHLHGSLARYEQADDPCVLLVNKPTFGCDALPGRVQTLCGGAPARIELCGVVTDICVISNAILLHSHFLNAEICVHEALCAAATPESHRRALAVLAGMGYQLLQP